MNIHEANKNIGRLMAEALGLVEAFDADHKERRKSREDAAERAGGYTRAERARVRARGDAGRRIAANNKRWKTSTPLSRGASKEMADEKERPNTPRSGRSSQTGRNMSGFGLRR